MEDVQGVARGADGAVDDDVNQDHLGLDRVYIQAKRWEGSVGRVSGIRFVRSHQRHSARAQRLRPGARAGVRNWHLCQTVLESGVGLSLLGHSEQTPLGILSAQEVHTPLRLWNQPGTMMKKCQHLGSVQAQVVRVDMDPIRSSSPCQMPPVTISRSSMHTVIYLTFLMCPSMNRYQARSNKAPSSGFSWLLPLAQRS